MAAGLPVVASEVGGVGELVRDGETGLLVAPADPAALAAAIERLLGDARLRHELGDAGHARVRAEHDLAAWRQAHVELYARELSRRSVPGTIP
jgi:glycosyltransferase involved in cell wall biosynthesis